MPADETGTRKASLEFGIIAYDEDGRKLNGLDTRVEDTISAARYEKLAAGSYRAAQTVFVPVTEASLRLAVRDVTSNRTGSLEVRLPLAKTIAAETREVATPTKSCGHGGEADSRPLPLNCCVQQHDDGGFRPAMG